MLQLRVLGAILGAVMLAACAAPTPAPVPPVTAPAPGQPVTQPAPGTPAPTPLVKTAVTVPAAFRSAYPGGDRPLNLPSGFAVSVYAAGLKAPRHLAQGPDGAVYVAEKDAGRISRLPDPNGDGVADGVEPYATGLELPHSVEWYGGDLYVGATDGIYRFRPPVKPGDKGVRLVELPARGGHWSRTAHFGPDGKLYVTVGSTCNVCQERDPRRAAMWVYNADGSGGRLFASGLRNTVDFAFHPTTGQIWGVDNGRDQLGDNLPPEELNLIVDGGNFGWPVCHGDGIVDPNLGKENSCQGVTGPAVAMQAHSAPLGVAFYTGSRFPAAFRDRVYISFHGSWNRSEKTGYKLVSVPLRDGRPAGPPEDFLTGWLQDSGVWGRPVGVLQTKDGALLVADDQGGVIYRITYTQP